MKRQYIAATIAIISASILFILIPAVDSIGFLPFLFLFIIECVALKFTE